MGSEDRMSAIGAPPAGLSATEIDRVEEMVQWALSERYRGLRFVVPNDGSCLQNDLLGVPVSRTAIVDGIELMGRPPFGKECSLCTLHRTPDGPVIVGRPVSALTVEPSRSRLPYDFSQIRSPFPFGVDLSRIPAPRFSLALAGGGALIASGVLAGIAPVVAPAATSAVQTAAMPGPLPDPGPSGWGAIVAQRAIAPVPPVQQGGNDGFYPLPGQPGVPDFSRPYDATEGDLADDHTQAGRGAAAGVPAPASLDSVIPPAGQGLKPSENGAPAKAAPPAPPPPSGETPEFGVGSENFNEAYEAGQRKRAEMEGTPAPDPEPAPAPEPQDGAAEEAVRDVIADDGQEQDSAAEVAEVAPEPVEPPVTEAPPPAPPPPIEAAEVTPAESEVASERPAGVQDPAAMREAAGHYRAAADLLEQAAAEIEAGDAALAAGESEVPDGQGGSVGDTAEDEAAARADGDSVEDSDVDLDGVRVAIDVNDLKVTVNGVPVDVEFGDTAGHDATEVTAA